MHKKLCDADTRMLKKYYFQSNIQENTYMTYEDEFS